MPPDKSKKSKLTTVELSELRHKPYGCPDEVSRSWARLKATHTSVSALFETLNTLRASQPELRGSISEAHRDQVRAAIVFTAAGIDACLRTLLRDALGSLLRTEGRAHNAFKSHFMAERLSNQLTRATKKAVVDIDPRASLIDLYVQDLAGSSIQGSKDLTRCRDALGISGSGLEDAALQTHDDFFSARHEVVHELDLVDPSGKGSRSRRHRDLAIVGKQCDDALRLVFDFIAPTAVALRRQQRETPAAESSHGSV